MKKELTLNDFLKDIFEWSNFYQVYSHIFDRATIALALLAVGFLITDFILFGNAILFYLVGKLIVIAVLIILIPVFKKTDRNVAKLISYAVTIVSIFPLVFDNNFFISRIVFIIPALGIHWLFIDVIQKSYNELFERKKQVTDMYYQIHNLLDQKFKFCIYFEIMYVLCLDVNYLLSNIISYRKKNDTELNTLEVIESIEYELERIKVHFELVQEERSNKLFYYYRLRKESIVEDSAKKIIEAAKKIQKSIDEINSKYDINLGIRIGIAIDQYIHITENTDNKICFNKNELPFQYAENMEKKCESGEVLLHDKGYDHIKKYYTVIKIDHIYTTDTKDKKIETAYYVKGPIQRNQLKITIVGNYKKENNMPIELNLNTKEKT